jgi:hypothetical protein
VVCYRYSLRTLAAWRFRRPAIFRLSEDGRLGPYPDRHCGHSVDPEASRRHLITNDPFDAGQFIESFR